MKYTFAVIALCLSASPGFASTASSEAIKGLSARLAGGSYKGINTGAPCTVSVVDNGADGSGYAVSVSPTLSGAMASFSVLEGDEAMIGTSGGSIHGMNDVQTLTIDKQVDGAEVVVTKMVAGQLREVGVCKLP